MPPMRSLYDPGVDHRAGRFGFLCGAKGNDHEKKLTVIGRTTVEMADSFDDFTCRLQQRIFEETKEAFGTAAFQRWRNPLYMGTMQDPDGHARVHGKCGDTMEIFLKFDGEQVKEALFQTDGCGSSTVCGSFAAELAHGKSPDELAEITGELILDVLGGLPKEDRHCAFLAAETLQEALEDYMKRHVRENNSETKDDSKNA